jgi:hypothetical protein
VLTWRLLRWSHVLQHRQIHLVRMRPSCALRLVRLHSLLCRPILENVLA